MTAKPSPFTSADTKFFSVLLVFCILFPLLLPFTPAYSPHSYLILSSVCIGVVFGSATQLAIGFLLPRISPVRGLAVHTFIMGYPKVFNATCLVLSLLCGLLFYVLVSAYSPVF